MHKASLPPRTRCKSSSIQRKLSNKHSNLHSSLPTQQKRKQSTQCTFQAINTPTKSSSSSHTPSTNRRKRVAVGISGGVDSATTAALLLSQGYEVIPIYMSNWDSSDENNQCTGEEDLFQARKVAQHLGLELHEVNFTASYWTNIFEQVLKGYSNGITPNPDILCNKHIKFGVFFDYALKEFSPDYVATGHYARVSYSSPISPASLGIDTTSVTSNLINASIDVDQLQNLQQKASELMAAEPFSIPQHLLPTFHSSSSFQHNLVSNCTSMPHTFPNQHINQLFADPHILSSLPQFRTYDPVQDHTTIAYLSTAIDSVKDQTYFLSAIPPEKLAKVLFPIGHIPKKLTRNIATALNLPNFDRKDSMGVCFVGQKGDFGDFLAQYLSDEQQYPGSILSIEQFVELMQIYLTTQQSFDKKFFSQRDSSENNVILEKSIPLDDFVPLQFLQHVTSDPHSSKLRHQIQLNIQIQDKDYKTVENDLKYQNINESHQNYTKRLKSMTYHNTIPLSEDQLTPHLPKNFHFTITPSQISTTNHNNNHNNNHNHNQNKKAAQTAISITEQENINRVLLPFNQQQHERINVETLPISTKSSTLDNILSVQYNSSNFIPQFTNHAVDTINDFCSTLTRFIPQGDPAFAPIQIKINELINHAMKLSQQLNPTDISNSISSSSSSSSSSTPSSPSSSSSSSSTHLETLCLISSVPLFQQITHFIHHFQQLTLNSISPATPTPPSLHSKLPLFYQLIDIITPPADLPLPSITEFIQTSAPIWFEIINSALNSVNNQSISEQQIKSLRKKLNEQFPATIKLSFPSKGSDTIENVPSNANNQVHSVKNAKNAKTVKQSLHPPVQSIYHQQSHILLKLLPNCALSNANIVYSNYMTGKGIHEQQTDFDTTTLLRSLENVPNLPLDSSTAHSFLPPSLVSPVNMLIKSNEELVAKTKFVTQNNADMHTEFPPQHIKRLLTDQSKNNHSNTNNTQKSLTSQPSLQFTLHSTSFLQDSVDTYLNPSIDLLSAPKLSSNTLLNSQSMPTTQTARTNTPLLETFSTQTAADIVSLSIFKQIQRVHYQIQSNIVDIISFRTKLALIRNGHFTRVPFSSSLLSPHMTSSQSQQYNLNISLKPLAAQWKRAFQGRNRFGQYFPPYYQYQNPSSSFSSLPPSIVSPTTLLSSLRPSSTLLDLHSPLTSPTMLTLLTRTSADSILHHKSYKRWFGLYHSGLTRYTEKQHVGIGLGGQKEVVLAKLPQSNTLLYSTGSNHPFSLKSSCILPDFTPLSYNPLHLMQLPTQYNDLSLNNYSNETIQRLQLYSYDLFNRSSENYRLWSVSNEFRLHSEENRLKKDQIDTNEENNGENGAQRAGPPPTLFNSNAPTFSAYKALFPFSDYGFTSDLTPSPIHTALHSSFFSTSSPISSTSATSATSSTPHSKQSSPQQALSTGYKAYAKVRSTGQMLPCRLILEDIPYKTYLASSIQKMNPSNIVSFLDNERLHSQLVLSTRNKLNQAYSLLSNIDSILTQQSPHTLFHPLQQPLLHSNSSLSVPFPHISTISSSQLFHPSALSITPLGQLRNHVEQHTKKLETHLHLIEPVSSQNYNTSNAVNNNDDNNQTIRRVLRVFFDESQEYLSNGQTIAIYIPTSTTTSPPTPLSPQNTIKTLKNHLSTPESDVNINANLETLSPSPLKHTQHHRFHTILDADYRYEDSLYSSLSFDLTDEYSTLLDERKVSETPHHVLFDTYSNEPLRNPSIPSAFDRFICLGSGTIVL